MYLLELSRFIFNMRYNYITSHYKKKVQRSWTLFLDEKLTRKIL